MNSILDGNVGSGSHSSVLAVARRSDGIPHPAIFGGLAAGALLLGLFLLPADALAQAAGQGAGAREMRHFWHVFVAFGLAWILVFAWVATIVRRLRRVEDSLGSRGGGSHVG